MARSAVLRPDVLVLAGGGIVGEAWMHGVLAGIEDAGGTDFRETEAYVGTSAGAIVAARLAGGRRPPRPDRAPARRRGCPPARPTPPVPRSRTAPAWAGCCGVPRGRAGPPALR